MPKKRKKPSKKGVRPSRYTDRRDPKFNRKHKGKVKNEIVRYHRKG